MKNIYKLLIPIATLFCYTSCGDFLEENSTNQVYVDKISDINELILGEGYMTQGMSSYSNMYGVKTNAIGAWIHVMDDDLRVQVNSSSTSYNKWANTLGPFHFWQQDPFITYTMPFTGIVDVGWPRLYKHINAMNVIIFELDDKFSGQKDYAKLKGEAMFLRALYYYFLVNLYAVPYDVNTATTDPGVPIKLSETVDDKEYARESVAAVYDQIVKDLTKAVDLLAGVSQTSIYRPNQTAARLLLSRVYLYMSRWSDCVAQCDQIMKDQRYSLSDFTKIAPKDNKLSAKSPETIFSNGDYRILAIVGGYCSADGTNNGYNNGYRVSQSLLDIIDKETDSRFTYFVYGKDKYGSGRGGYYPTYKFFKNTDGDISDCCTFRLAEVYLNRAEALAMQGSDKESEAATTLTSLRAKRFKAPFNYNVAATGTDLINLIRDERRRELCFEGHRWFDLRRYAVNKVLPLDRELRHEFDDGPDNVADGYPDGYYILPKYSLSPKGGNYVLPIPATEIQVNGGKLIDNVRTDVVRVEGMN